MKGSKTGGTFHGFFSSMQGELIPGLPELRMTGSRSLLLEPHGGLRAFSGERVLVSVGKGLLCIRGKGLTIKRLSLRTLWLKGEIHSLELTGSDAD